MNRNFTQILVPIDFSETSERALDYAKTLAKAFGASLHLLHVFEDLSLTGVAAAEFYVPLHTDIRDALLIDIEVRLAELFPAADRKRLNGTAHVLAGSPAKAIVEHAANIGADLIVMGTHGRSGLAHLLIGSVAERVLRTAACPVLTVRLPPEAASGGSRASAA